MTEQPPVLTVEGLAKVYRLPRRSSSKGVPAEIWALRDVTFQVERGVVLGIIGPNGAGKTTLLRVLSRMTPPTRGRVTGSGRVVTMLDLAAGFHPDWTGRQNVLLSGAMLGIKRGDIEARLDEIVSFAEVASFIDVPLKHYSSGMSARLIFSTALHLEPDILLADEALAVGDLGFQERCVARVREAAAGGVSVLFVSHDLEVLRRICDRILRLDGGRVVEIGSPAAVLDRYRDAIYDGLDEGWRLRFKQQRKQRSNEWAAIDSVRVSSPPDDAVSGALSLQILMEVYEAEVVVSCAVELVSEGLEPVHAPQPEGILLTKPGVYSAIVRIPSGVFAAVAYTVTARATVAKGGVEQSIVKADALTFRIDESMGALPPASPDAAQPGRGDTLDLDWDLRRMKVR